MKTAKKNTTGDFHVRHIGITRDLGQDKGRREKNKSKKWCDCGMASWWEIVFPAGFAAIWVHLAKLGTPPGL